MIEGNLHTVAQCYLKPAGLADIVNLREACESPSILEWQLQNVDSTTVVICLPEMQPRKLSRSGLRRLLSRCADAALYAMLRLTIVHKCIVDNMGRQNDRMECSMLGWISLVSPL